MLPSDHLVTLLVVLLVCAGLKMTDALVTYLARHHVEYVKEILQECDTSSVNGLYLTFATTQVCHFGVCCCMEHAESDFCATLAWLAAALQPTSNVLSMFTGQLYLQHYVVEALASTIGSQHLFALLLRAAGP